MPWSGVPHSKRRLSLLSLTFMALAMLGVLAFVLSSSAIAQETPEIEVSGPDSVAKDETVQLEASTANFGEEDYIWYLSLWTGEQKPFEVDNYTGEVTGLNIGQGKISVVGVASGAQKTFDFYTDSGKEVTIFLSLQPRHGKGSLMEMEVDCEIKTEPPEGTKLLAGVEFNDEFYFLPDLSTEAQVFSQNPKPGTHELIQFPVEAIPFNTYTFYAATVDEEGEISSNIATQVFEGGSKN